MHPTAQPPGLRLVGDLCSGQIHHLAAALAGSAGGGGDFTLDLAGVGFMDSSGMQAIASAADDRLGRGRLVLDSPRPWVMKVLSLGFVEELPNVEVTEPPSEHEPPPRP